MEGPSRNSDATAGDVNIAQQEQRHTDDDQAAVGLRQGSLKAASRNEEYEPACSACPRPLNENKK